MRRFRRVRVLFHGTTRAVAERARVEGLKPQVGAHVLSAYEPRGLVPLVFAASEPVGTVPAIRTHVAALVGRGPYQLTRGELVELGALVEVSADGFRHRAEDDSEGAHPLPVEPGDWYSLVNVPVLRVWSPEELAEMLAGRR